MVSFICRWRTMSANPRASDCQTGAQPNARMPVVLL